MSERGAQPRVFTIAPDAPFLPTLVEAILDGTAVPSFRLDDDPLALADMRIFVPTRRAARELREVFVAKLGGRAAILPRITPIGDVDEESYLDEATLADEDALPPNISDLERRLVITRLVTSWSRRVGQDLAHPTGATEIGIPASPADAARLADDLIRLMDQVATERADWRKLVDLVPGDYALYWQLSLEFLKIVTEHWPAYLAERGLADPGARRDAAIERTARRLQAAPPTTPVIAAGSTGSAPATASLLAAIAKLPTGAVVLPGLDLDLAEDAWQAIGDRDTETATPSHPQYGMRQLIARIGIERADVGLLGGHPSPARALRSHIVNEALRPADVTDGWRLNTLPTPAEAQAAFEDVALIKAANEEEEALAIAIALREAIAEDQTAALVTPDRLLARRVARQLLRWNIRVDDSAGRPLATTPPAILARLVAETVLDGFEPQTLLAILKHPLARFGLPRPSLLRAARNLEIAVLRGPRAGKGSDGLCAAIEAVHAALARGDGYPHPAARALSTDDWAGIRDLGRRLQEAFAPLEALASAGQPVPVTELAAAHVATFERATRDEAGQLAQLTDPAAGRRLADFLTGFFAADAAGFSVAPGDWPALFGALLDGIAVRPAIPTDPRIFIWGPLEARLQNVDRLVLGGLSEGVWPAATRSDPWLSRPMRRDLGLEAPERRIGLSAHDFAQGLGAPRVVLTHPLRKDGAPTVDSRWLQRLSAVLGPDESTRITARGDRYLQLARTLDGAGGEAAPAPRPEPRPPVSSRPTSLSVTEIETLIRDPYAIYARHILRVEPLDDLGAAPDLAERGTILHAIFAAFIRARTAGDSGDPLDRLMAIGAAHFAGLEAFPDVHALWWPRFERIARRFLDWEAARRSMIARSDVEISGHLDIPLPPATFRLRGRADRIDSLTDGGLVVLDYKTGTAPSRNQVHALYAPQLPLEAAMARHAGFETVAPGPVGEIAYVLLKDDPFATFHESRAVGQQADDLAEKSVSQLTQLIAHYGDAETGYRSRARPMFERRFPGRYDHLARVKEWALGSEGEE